LEESESDPSSSDDEQEKKMSLEEVLNPFLDRSGAMFGAALMAATLVTVLAINAASQGSHERPVFWVTLPAAFVMLCFDLTMGWLKRAETRKIAHEGRRRAETMLAERAETRRKSVIQEDLDTIAAQADRETIQNPDEKLQTFAEGSSRILSGRTGEMMGDGLVSQEEKRLEPSKKPIPTTLVSLVADTYRWAQETFPTTMTVFHHLPLALVPFAFCMFVLVQALVTKGWVPVFAHAWDHWVEKTGTVGAIGGMGFVSVILCNVSLLYYNYQALGANL
jgi:Na+/H+ antiporter NhaD/arsenite permease-like protein